MSKYLGIAKKNIIFVKNFCKVLFYKPKDIPVPSFSGWNDTLVCHKISKEKRDIPKIIWFFWDKFEKPTIVKATIERVKELNPDHKVNLLSYDNINEYMDFSSLETKDASIQHKSDLIRLELLSRYGGFWCDATCIFNESFEWVHKINRENYHDLIGYYRARDTLVTDYPIIENWFLACHPDNEFIAKWKREVQTVISLGTKKYYQNLLERPDFNSIAQGSDRGEYHSVYFACQLAMRATPNFSFYLRKAEAGPYLYQETIQWDREKIAAIICRLPIFSKIPPVIKLTYSNRYLLPALIKFGLVKKHSILGNFLSILDDR
ncbi:glycosyltransferase family 32 protein [Kozakia baliensis]|uniref:glycosyltransferase family 32 protein n=1 Tax=Kozakia baliensis TaxID=153496 RepID=UPI0009DD87DA|nr:capsular polysaccharide synthesis protein [Kozakia baliensis]